MKNKILALLTRAIVYVGDRAAVMLKIPVWRGVVGGAAAALLAASLWPAIGPWFSLLIAGVMLKLYVDKLHKDEDRDVIRPAVTRAATENTGEASTVTTVEDWKGNR
jgi:hypothetical protein